MSDLSARYRCIRERGFALVIRVADFWGLEERGFVLYNMHREPLMELDDEAHSDLCRVVRGDEADAGSFA